MTDLTTKFISKTYKQVLLVSSSASTNGSTNTGVNTSLKAVQTGDGTNTALKIATNAIQITGVLGVTGSVSLDGNLHVDDKVCASAFYGDGSNLTNITSSIVVGANISTSGYVNVGTSLSVSGTSNVVGAASFQSSVTVVGAGTFKDDVSVSGNVNIGGTVTIAGAVSLASSLIVGGASRFVSNVSIEGAARVTGTVTIAGAVSLASTLSVGGASNFASTVTVVGAAALKSNVTVGGTLDVTGNTSIGGTFLATGKSEFEDDVSVSGALIVGGAAQFNSTVTVENSAILKNNVSIGGTLAVAGAPTFTSKATFSNDVSVSGRLDVATSACIGGSLTAVGKATFKDDVSVSGNMIIGGHVSIGGNVTAAYYYGDGSKLTNITASIVNNRVGGNFAVSANLSVGGTSNLTGAVSLASSLSVVGAANFASTVTVVGATHLQSTVSVNGVMTLNNDLDMQDDDKILIGTGDDLQIWHDGSNSIISDGGTGSLFIRGSNITLSAGADGAETWATFVDNGAVTLYYDNAVKFATSSVGISVTGSTTQSGASNPSAANTYALGSASLEWSDLFLGDGSVISFGNDQDVTLTHVADTGLTLNLMMAATTFEPSGDTASGDNAAIGYTAAEGLILTGQGSTSDVTLKNDADGTVFTVPTGTDDILFPDNAKAMWGTDSDLSMYHSGSYGYITNNTGTMHIGADALNLTNYAVNETYVSMVADAGVTLYFNNAAKLATVTGGIEVTGDVVSSGTIEPAGDTAAGDNAAIGYTSAEGLILTGQGSTSDITLKNDADAIVFTVPTGTDDILFPDGARARFGTGGADYSIWFDGAHAHLDNDTGGALYIASNTINLMDSARSEYHATMIQNGAVSLYYDNAVKLATVTGGVNITGELEADSLDIDGVAQIDGAVTVGVDDTGYDVKFFGAASGSYMLWDESTDDLILGGAAGLSVSGVASATTQKVTTRLFIGDIATSVPVSNGQENWTQSHEASNRGGITWFGTHNSNGGAEAVFAKGRSGSIGSFTTVAADDILGKITWCGDDGTDMNSVAAQIMARVDGTPGSNDMPGRLIFLTTGDGAASPTERMRITSAGLVGIGNTAPGEKLEVTGAINFTGGASSNAASTGKLTFESAGVFVQSRGADTSTRGKITLYQAASDGSLGRSSLAIDAAGLVGIGTTSPGSTLTVSGADTAGVLYVTQTAAGNNAARIIGSHASFTGNVLQPWTVRAASTAFDLIECVTNNGTEVPFRVRGDGQVTSSAGAAFTGTVTVGSEGTAATTNVSLGLNKAWVRTYGTGVTITDSFNMTSVTDSGVGLFAPVIANNMNDANYAVVTGADDKQDGAGIFVHNINDAVAQATTGYGTSFKKYAYAMADANQNAVSSVLGNLA